MNHHFAKKLEEITTKDPELLGVLMESFTEGKMYKGQMILRPDEVSRNIYIIQSGITRHYRHDLKGKSFNTWFSFEGDVVLALESFVNQSPSKEVIEVMEDCEFISIHHEDVLRLREKYHLMETLFRELIELYYIELEHRLYRIQTYSAQQKYEYLVEHKPHFLRRLPQNHIASFLGITKETLSRIRSKVRAI